MTGHGGHQERWFDRDAGPVVRPYAVTKGRTQPGTAFGLIDVVVATGQRPSEYFRPGPEHRRILGLCQRPVPVADVTSAVDLPLGVVASCSAIWPTRDCCAPSPVTATRSRRCW